VDRAETEGAKFWLRVMNELKNRGVEDVLIAVVDGLEHATEIAYVSIEKVMPVRGTGALGLLSFSNRGRRSPHRSKIQCDNERSGRECVCLFQPMPLGAKSRHSKC
jgi:hypothetical protein